MTRGSQAVTVLVFGALRRWMDEKGLPYVLEQQVPNQGVPAHDLAEGIGIPSKEIEAVFRNGRVVNIHDRVHPGDRVAFFPYGTPGPYRVFLGMARENKNRLEREKAMAEAKNRT